MDTLKELCGVLRVAMDDLELLEKAELPQQPPHRPNSIAALRKAAGMTQQELAEKIGIHWVTLSKMERGGTTLKWPQMVKVGEVFGVDPGSIGEATGAAAATRLAEARENAGYESATRAAQVFGWNENTYRSHENGMRGLKPKQAKLYAEAFSVKAEWLLGLEPDSDAKTDIATVSPLGSDLEPDRVKRWIKDVCAMMGVTPSELARRASVSHTTLSRFLAGREGSKHLSGSTLASLASVAEVYKMNKQFEKEGLTEPGIP